MCVLDDHNDAFLRHLAFRRINDRTLAVDNILHILPLICGGKRMFEAGYPWTIKGDSLGHIVEWDGVPLEFCRDSDEAIRALHGPVAHYKVYG